MEVDEEGSGVAGGRCHRCCHPKGGRGVAQRGEVARRSIRCASIHEEPRRGAHTWLPGPTGRGIASWLLLLERHGST